MKLKTHASIVALLALATIIASNSVRAAAATSTNETKQIAPGQMRYFYAVNDPIEGFNRCSWAVNDWFFRGVIFPLSKGYNFVAPKPMRSKISNAGHNLTYPVRLVNSCFQGKWKGSGTCRARHMKVAL